MPTNTSPMSCSHFPYPKGTATDPETVASGLRQREGFVWIDSPLQDPSPGRRGISLLATQPSLLLEGSAGDWPLLEHELKRRRLRTPQDGGLDHGVAVGFFRFDGSYLFGFYEDPLIHDGTAWSRDPGDFSGPSAVPTAPASPVFFQPEISGGTYAAMVRRAKEYIATGDIYQVCLSHRFSVPFGDDPWPLYLSLRKESPAPHAAYLSLGDEVVLSSSPECFLRMSGSSITTRPIKGTRPRGAHPEEDTRLARELKASAKEAAELLMITDLERNDLGKVCEFGSVEVERLLELERHPQVFHLVSTVTGRLREGVSHVAALAACFPGGSISGAPKKRALEIINELEPAPRGLFTGAIGYFGYNGESQFNIAIRTVTIRGGRAEFHVGAGITADSDPEQEWEETLHKAAGILKASGGGKASESAL